MENQQHPSEQEDPSQLQELLDEPPKKNNDVYNQAMESFLRITVAGFGGALVGISLARTRSASALTRTIGQRGKPFQQNDLPAQWAVAFLTFSSVFEATRIMSPTSILLQLTNNSVDFDALHASRHYITIGDYTLGGCMAGAVLRGMPVSAASVSRRSIAAPPRLGAGLLSGLALGFIPGVALAGIQMLEEKVEAYEEATRQQEEDEAVDEASQQDGVTAVQESLAEESKPDGQEAEPETPKKKKGLLGLGWFGL